MGAWNPQGRYASEFVIVGLPTNKRKHHRQPARWSRRFAPRPYFGR